MQYVEKGLIIEHQKLHKDIFLLKVLVPLICQECNPGQFLHVRVGNTFDPLLRRPLSIYDADKERGIIELLYKVVGKGTQLLAFMQKGESVDIMGPLGKGFSLPSKGLNTVLVGGGMGIAPLVFLARQLQESGYNIWLFYGAANSQELVAEDKIKKMGIEIWTSTMDGSRGHKGLVTDLFSQAISPDETDYIYTCGPEPMMAAIAEFATKNHIAGEMSLEEHMACGVGACLGCARKLNKSDSSYVKICKDGPVFSFDKIKPEKH
ncbi:MAG: dihydroorotate dehydrogenase electron transfer subunit [Syntrophomonadaceae bacterium]